MHSSSESAKTIEALMQCAYHDIELVQGLVVVIGSLGFEPLDPADPRTQRWDHRRTHTSARPRPRGGQGARERWSDPG